MRVLKGVVLDDIRWRRWDSMLTNTFKLAATHTAEPVSWFANQLTITLQRLLKGIPAEKAV